MRGTVVISLLMAGAVLLGGCGAGKQRKEIIRNIEEMRADQKTNQDQLVKNQQATLDGQQQMQTNVDKILADSNKSLGMQQNVLSLVTDTNTKVTDGNHKMGLTLDAIYREVYGLGVDFKGAVGETRVVIAVKNDKPLRVHAEIPTGESAGYEPVDRLPVGSMIFQAQEVTKDWMKGIIMRNGEKETVYFSSMHTKPLRDTITPPAPGGPTQP